MASVQRLPQRLPARLQVLSKSSIVVEAMKLSSTSWSSRQACETWCTAQVAAHRRTRCTSRWTPPGEHLGDRLDQFGWVVGSKRGDLGGGVADHGERVERYPTDGAGLVGHDIIGDEVSMYSFGSPFEWTNFSATRPAVGRWASPGLVRASRGPARHGHVVRTQHRCARSALCRVDRGQGREAVGPGGCRPQPVQ